MVISTSLATIISLILATNVLLVQCVHAQNDYPNCYIKHSTVLNKDFCRSSNAKHFNVTKTCTALLFEHKMYEIRSKCKISDHDQLDIVGNGATIICHNSKSLLVFASISKLQVSNITLVNCNIRFAYFNISEPSSVLLFNVTSVQLSNVMFNNSSEFAVYEVNSKNILIVNTDCENNREQGTDCDGIPSNKSSMCYCKGSHENCSTNIRIDQNIYPGQDMVLPLKSLSDHKAVVYVVSQRYKSNATKCKVAYSSLSHPINFVHNSCTEITYTIMSNSSNWCLLYLRTATNDDTPYTYNITLRSCPPGLVLHGGLCVCNPQLEANGIKCNISVGTFITPPDSWISKVGNTSDMMYSTECYMDYCSKVFMIVNLSEPQQQCLTNRDGTICGKCAEGYSAVFGTSNCKKCSNIWLLLIPGCAVAGVLLVLFLFMLNLTVVDGDIHGFLLYVNMLSIYSEVIFPPQHRFMYLPIMMANLDIGVEVCFYDGMTNYATIWLQFIFPIYVILLVVGLSYASRHFSIVEKLTRKRVIPVIATLYLLAFNKMMLTTAKGFSYRRVHYLNSDITELYWAVDTSIPFMGPEFVVQLVFCSLILLLILLPTTILFLVPKDLMRYKFVYKFLKPFLDAYQAPFKDDCCYFLGLEFLTRAILYGLDSVRAKYTAAIMMTIVLIYLVYLGCFQPFKSSINNLLYSVYWCNLGCTATLFICFFPRMPKAYIVIFDVLICLGFLLFLGIVVVHFCKYLLHKELNYNIPGKFKLSFMKSVLDPSQEPEAMAASYEKFQDDLLAINPDN
ncbi:uncharacterized protein [Dysidea avara]|uniref:uncharacterized protein n=1 Tax=Dysidea avara TaxID=196820 RepID=UPI00333106DD